MKRLLSLSLLVLMTAMAFLSGCKVKYDCRGHLKHRLSNGIWI